MQFCNGLILLLGIMCIVVLSVIVYFFINNIVLSIKKNNHVLKCISEGDLSQSNKLAFISSDEIGDMAIITNKLIDNLNQYADFTRNIGNGNLKTELTNIGINDTIGKSLLDMQQSLKISTAEEKKRKIIDDRINWSTNGESRFGNILRQYNQNIDELSYNIISNLVDYMGVIQGGIFIKNENNEEDIYFELASSVAYNRQKLLERKFRIGESLIGRCAYEKLTIYLEEVPEDYVHITSGLGESNPRSILIVPAVLNNNIIAIIELVSFNKFEPHQIEFVEKIGEIIASSIVNIKTNINTNRLLKQSKQQSEELAAQEEEMRQNLEELQAAQEEVIRLREEEKIKNSEMLEKVKKYKNALSKILDYIPIKIFLKDKDCRMLIVNQKVLDVHSETRENLIGKNDFDFIDNYEEAKKGFDAEQNIIKSGEPFNQVHTENIDNTGIVLNTTKYPFYIDYLDEIGILGVQLDITELTHKNEEIEQLKKEVYKLKQK